MSKLTQGRERASDAALFVGTLAARAAFLAAAARATGVRPLDLALLFDGHAYLTVAKTLPRLYQGVPAFLPRFSGSEYFTGWFPLYPVLIRAAAALTGDARAAALIVSMLASAAAVLLFRRVAAFFTPRHGAAAAVFALFPPVWLLTGSLTFVEPVFLCAFLAAVLAVLEDRPWTCACAAAAALLAQKSGFLVLPILLALRLERRGWAGLRAFSPCLLSPLPLAALQLYLWRVFGDPFVNLHVQRDIFGGALFGLPLAAFVRGAITPSPLGGPLHRALFALSGASYLAVAAAAWRRGRREERPLLAWLLVVLACHFSLSGPWAFYSLPRLLLLGAPAALLLALPLLPSGDWAILGAAALAPVWFCVGLIEAARGAAVTSAAWTPGYLAAASRVLR
jgi:hypothetical protein